MVPVTTIGRALRLLFLPLLLIASGAANAEMAAAGATFGEKPSFQSATNFLYVLSGDKQAFTITFNPAFEAAVGSKSTDTAPVGTNILSFAVPVSGGKDIDASVTFVASTTAEEGAGGLLMVIVNDKQTITRFKKKSESELLVTVRYRSKYEKELRVTVFLLAERDSAHAKAAALIHASSLDADLAPGKSKGKKDKK